MARSWGRQYNCEYHGGRIRLDNVPGDRKHDESQLTDISDPADLVEELLECRKNAKH